jgi:hypothetical protein
MVDQACILIHGLRAPGQDLFSGSDQAIQDDSDRRDKKKLDKHRYSIFGDSTCDSDIDALMLPRKGAFSPILKKFMPTLTYFSENAREASSFESTSARDGWQLKPISG